MKREGRRPRQSQRQRKDRAETGQRQDPRQRQRQIFLVPSTYTPHKIFVFPNSTWHEPWASFITLAFMSNKGREKKEWTDRCISGHFYWCDPDTCNKQRPDKTNTSTKTNINTNTSTNTNANTNINTNANTKHRTLTLTLTLTMTQTLTQNLRLGG
jgi:hypothetical protein